MLQTSPKGSRSSQSSMHQQLEDLASKSKGSSEYWKIDVSGWCNTLRLIPSYYCKHNIHLHSLLNFSFLLKNKNVWVYWNIKTTSNGLKITVTIVYTGQQSLLMPWTNPAKLQIIVYTLIDQNIGCNRINHKKKNTLNDFPKIGWYLGFNFQRLHSPKVDIFNKEETQLCISRSILRSTFIVLVGWGFLWRKINIFQ